MLTVSRWLEDAMASVDGLSPWTALPGLFLLIVAATLVSEDLTCIGVGILVAENRLGFAFGTAACLVGLYAGDLSLYVAGRWAGRPALERPPLSWLIRRAQVDRACSWFRDRGLSLVLTSRFVPGARLPTYFAAGVLAVPLRGFAVQLFVANALWTPLLVGASALVGDNALNLARSWGTWTPLAVVATAGAVVLVTRMVLPSVTRRGRRRVVGAWRRCSRWEFWPAWLLYAPVAVYASWLGIRHRSLALFTACNPAMPAGGVIGESKSAILELLGPGAPVARFTRVPAREAPERRQARVDAFLREQGLELPLVVKPDVGERGAGVRVVRRPAELHAALDAARGDVIVQEHVQGEEFGVFWLRRPGSPRGEIFSITIKRLPEVVGDGRRTLEELILDDPRACAIADSYLEANASRAAERIPEGQRVRLVELGTHCRGAVFLDGRHLRTPALEDALERIAGGVPGFDLGRFDVRAPSEQALREGRDIKILELNGVTSEAAHIYDPELSLSSAWRTLCEQWRLAYRIGAYRRGLGHRPLSAAALLRLLVTREAPPSSRARGSFGAESP